MSFEIELFLGTRFAALGRIPLTPIVRISLERILQQSLKDTSVQLLLLRVRDRPPVDRKPHVINLGAELGYATVIVKRGDQVIYRHPHPLDELVADALRTALPMAFPGEDTLGYCIVGPGLPSQVRQAPAVPGAVAVEPYGQNERPTFQIKRVEPEPLPRASLLDFVPAPAPDDRGAFAKVLVHPSAYAALGEHRRFSRDVEEGGFLLGRVYDDSAADGTYLVEVTAAPEAQHTGASLIHLTFTGDSFQAVKQLLRDTSDGERLLGWYHTHLFPATDDMGLSSIDVGLHFTTFRLSWQLAGLVNLDSPTRRTVRFYVRQGSTMALCPHWILR
jgi:hypothetical protein